MDRITLTPRSDLPRRNERLERCATSSERVAAGRCPSQRRFVVRGGVEPPTLRFSDRRRPFATAHTSVFPQFSDVLVFAPVRARSRQVHSCGCIASVAANRRRATRGERLRRRTEPPARSPSTSRVLVRSHADRSRHSTRVASATTPDTQLPSAPATSITYFALAHSKVALSPRSRDLPDQRAGGGRRGVCGRPPSWCCTRWCSRSRSRWSRSSRSSSRCSIYFALKKSVRPD